MVTIMRWSYERGVTLSQFTNVHTFTHVQILQVTQVGHQELFLEAVELLSRLVSVLLHSVPHVHVALCTAYNICIKLLVMYLLSTTFVSGMCTVCVDCLLLYYMT